MKRKQLRFLCASLLMMMCMSIHAQTTTTFTYTATEKITRFEDEGFKSLFVGATAVQSHTYDAGTKAGTVVYEGEVTALGNNALQFQSALTSIVIPEGVTSIGYKAFYQCTNMTTIKLPKSLKLIGDVSGLTFDGCIGLANGKFIIDDIAWWCALDIKGCFSNPIYYAKHIYSDEDTEITNLVIPEGVTSIGHDAFYRCEGITSISFPSTLESIGASAFNSCTNIASVAISKDASIGESCFANCSGLTSVTIPEGVETIGASAFCKTGLTSLTLPSTIRSMSQSFYGCESLTELTLKDGITTLGGSFYSCTALASVNIPGSVKEVGYSDFSSCTGLTTVTLNEGTEKVQFNSCTNLETINFPSTIKEVTITRNEKLETVTLNEGMQEINSFNYCSALKQINIPSTVTYVGTFRDCSALEKVIVADIASWCAARHYDSRYYGPQKMAGKLYLGTPASYEQIINLIVPEGVGTIRADAFYNVPTIATVTLPSTLTTIESYAFYGCTGVKDVFCDAVPFTSWTDYSDSFMAEKGTLWHVTKAALDSWETQYPDANVKYMGDLNELSLSEDNDNSLAIAGRDGRVCTITLSRTLKTGSWNTFAVPFNVSAGQITSVLGAGSKVKKLTASSYDSGTKTLTMNFADAASIEAGKPYLVKVAANVENPEFASVTVNATVTPTATDNVDFVPAFGKTLVTSPAGNESDTQSVLILGAANKLFHPTVVNDATNDDSYIKGFRAYFQLHEAGASSNTFVIDFGNGETTSLNEELRMKNEESTTADGWYTLDGRKLNQAPAEKGLYINNGKKVILK